MALLQERLETNHHLTADSLAQFSKSVGAAFTFGVDTLPLLVLLLPPTTIIPLLAHQLYISRIICYMYNL